MRMVLRRREFGFGGTDPDVYIRAVFAHISNKIMITHVSLQGKQKQSFFADQQEIVVHFHPYEVSNPNYLQKIITEAVSLRGDLTLISLDLTNSLQNRFEL